MFEGYRRTYLERDLRQLSAISDLVDFDRALRLFLQEYGKHALGGLVIHTGSETGWLTTDILAAPWWRIL